MNHPIYNTCSLYSVYLIQHVNVIITVYVICLQFVIVMNFAEIHIIQYSSVKDSPF